MNKEAVDKYLNTLDSIGLADYIKKTAQSVHRLTRQQNKAMETEFKTPTHSSRARRTTVFANVEKISIVLNGEKDVLKYIVTKL